MFRGHSARVRQGGIEPEGTWLCGPHEARRSGAGTRTLSACSQSKRADPYTTPNCPAWPPGGERRLAAAWPLRRTGEDRLHPYPVLPLAPQPSHGPAHQGMSGWRDSNARPRGPQPRALTKLGHTPWRVPAGSNGLFLARFPAARALRRARCASAPRGGADRVRLSVPASSHSVPGRDSRT